MCSVDTISAIAAWEASELNACGRSVAETSPGGQGGSDRHIQSRKRRFDAQSAADESSCASPDMSSHGGRVEECMRGGT